jgi:hypothetical protein
LVLVLCKLKNNMKPAWNWCEIQIKKPKSNLRIDFPSQLPLPSNLFGMMNLGFLESFSSLKLISDMLHG